MALTDKMVLNKLWTTAKLLMVGSEKEGKLFGHYQIYETLKYQYEGGELNEDQLKIMGLNRVITV
jgi:hypothetical protein